MNSPDKTREELVAELAELRERIALLESAPRTGDRPGIDLEDDLRVARMLAEAAADSIDTRQVAAILATEIQRVFDSHSVNLYVISPDGTRLEMQALGLIPGIIDAAERLLGRRIPLVYIPRSDDSSYWQTIERGTIAIYRTRAEVEAVIHEFESAATAMPGVLPKNLSVPIDGILKILALESSVHIPLSSRGRQLGLLSVSARHQLTDTEISRLTSISIHVAGILAAAQAEQDWRRERDRAEMYSDIAAGPLMYIGADATVLSINPAGCSLIGLPENEIVGRNWIQSFVPAHMRESGMAGLATAVEGEVAEWFEMPVLTADGEERTVRWRASVVRDEGGLPTGFLASGIDLTRVRESEEREARNRRQHRALIENSTDLTVILDADGFFTYAGPSVVHILGYTPGEIVGTQAANYIHPDDAELYVRAMREAANSRDVTMAYAVRAKGKDGAWRVLEGRASQQFDNPDVEGIIVNLRDATESERIEGSIENSAARFRALIENSRELMLVLGADLGIRYASPSCSRSLGYTETSLVGLSFEELVHGEDLDREVFRQSGAHDVASVRRTMRLRTDDRQWVPYRVAISRHLDDPAIQGFILNATPAQDES